MFEMFAMFGMFGMFGIFGMFGMFGIFGMFGMFWRAPTQLRLQLAPALDLVFRHNSNNFLVLDHQSASAVR